MNYVLESKKHKLVSHIVYKNDSGWGMDFLKGLPVAMPRSKDELFVEAEHKVVALPDYFEVDGVPVISERFVKAIESTGTENYQAIPINVHFEDGINSEHFLMNVIGRIKCFDEKNTDCSKFGPSVARVFRLKLDDNISHGSDLFRAKEYQEIIFINEKIKMAIDNANLSGYEVRDADGWNDSHRF